MVQINKDNFLDIDKILSEAWLNIRINDDDIEDTFNIIPEEFEDNPEHYLTWVMSQPDFFSFTCKELFGFKILPFQGIVLKELWTRKFPMMVCTRGFSKTSLLGVYSLLSCLFGDNEKIIICGSSFRQAKLVFNYIEQLIENSQILRDIVYFNKTSPIQHHNDGYKLSIGNNYVLGLPLGCLTEDTFVTTVDGVKTMGDFKKYLPKVYSNGKYRDVGFFFDNGTYSAKKITTKYGYSFTGTPNHKMKIVRDEKIQWVRSDEMVIGDRIIIDRSVRWHNKESNISNKECYNCGLNADASVPDVILQSHKEKMTHYLRGLFDNFSSVKLLNQNGDVKPRLKLTLNSSFLLRQVHYILLHYGIISKLDGNNIIIRDYNYRLYCDNIGSGKPDWANRLAFMNSCGKFWTYIDDTIPSVCGRITFNNVNRIKKINFNEELNNKNYYYDTIELIEDIERIYTCDINVPDGNEYCANGFFSHNTGDKIRGQRATKIIVDEFSSVPIDIFETVIAGFAAVSSNPADKVRRLARERLAQKLGIELEEVSSKSGLDGNQIVLSGTAYYDFNHFAQYHKRWSEIIKSRGDKEKLRKAINSDTDVNLNWKDFSIIRVPASLLPYGFMDDDQLSRSKATMSSANYEMEFECQFSKDSQGFFKRTLIESCVVKPGMDWVLPNGVVINNEEVFYEPMLRGNPNKQYVFAVDPAARLDNFSIAIIERNIGYRKLVYCWTTNEKRHKKLIESGFVKEKNYYAHCCRKIRDLMKDFNCVGIGIDYGGGGGAIINGLQDEDKLEPGELPIYHMMNYEKKRDTDGKHGLHIIHEVNFTSDWSQQANHSLRKDMEDKLLLFPYIDGISYAETEEQLDVEDVTMQKDKPISIDPYSEVVYEIEELKSELSMIVVTETATGKEHWDTPETKTNTGKKSRLRKDRYSALLMANDTCRQIFKDESLPRASPTDGGGFASVFKKKDNKEKMFSTGPDWVTNALNAAYD